MHSSLLAKEIMRLGGGMHACMEGGIRKRTWLASTKEHDKEHDSMYVCICIA